MRTIVIKNIGPIVNAELDLSQILVLVGPQSQGKSTIAKLVSFFLWLEKHVVSRQKTDDIDKAFISERLMHYHRMESFFSEDSYLEYKSNILSFSLKGREELEMVPKAIREATAGKIVYIPAERMVLGLQNIASLKMEDDYIRDFIFDWLSIRNKYGKENKLALLNLQMDYFFDSVGGRDSILLQNGKELSVVESSSGVQSIVPIMVFYDYLTKWLYENQEDISFEQNENLKVGYANLIKNDEQFGDVYEPFSERLIKLFVSAKHFKEIESQMNNDNIIGPMYRAWERISRPHFSQIIVEEPELSLYPETQLQLLAYMLRSINLERGDGLFLTTHSPYLLNALNLMFKAHDTSKPVLGASLDFDKTRVYYVNAGSVVDIKAKNAHLVNPEALSEPLDSIYEQYENLN